MSKKKYSYGELMTMVRGVNYQPTFPFFEDIDELEELGLVKVWPAEHALADGYYTLPKGEEPVLEWARVKDSKRRLAHGDPHFMVYSLK